MAYGHPLDHDIYAGFRWVSEPLRLFDCSRENDGAAAVLVTSAERARDLRSAPAYVLSGVQGAGPDWSESAENNSAYTSAGFHPALVARLWCPARTSRCSSADRLRRWSARPRIPPGHADS